MKKLLFIVLSISLSLLCFSCYYDEVLEMPTLPTPEDVSFQNDIQPIFTASCTSCHDQNLDPDLRDGTAFAALMAGNYIVVGNADNSELFNKLPGIGHPVNIGFSLNADEIALIKAWIDEGAKNN